MARVAHVNGRRPATPVWAGNQGIKSSLVAVGTTALPLPATNLSARSGLWIQNLDAAKIVYWGGSIPEMYLGSKNDAYIETNHTTTFWKPSAGGTNEYYLVSATGGDASLTQPVRVFYQLIASAQGVESAATSGTVGSLGGSHYFGWGDGDTLGYNTLYVRTAGSTPKDTYRVLMGYPTVPDNSSSYGGRLAPYEGIYIDADGSVRVWGIASAASANVAVVEVI